MGAWGAAIFSDDTAADVRDEYRGLLGAGLDAVAATVALIERSKETVADPDEGPVFWLALALTQHKLGRLEARVKREALRAIDEGQGLDRWRESGPAALKSRLAALAKARAVLVSPQPAAKKIRPPFHDSCTWGIGELIAYRLNSGAHAVLRVVAHETHANGVGPVCELLDWKGKSVPSTESLRSCGVRRAMLSTWSLFQILMRTAPESASEPQQAMKRLLADMGLIDAADAKVSLLGLLGGDAPPVGFDMNQHLKRVERALDRVRADEPAVAKSLRRVAAQRNAKLLEPISQISLRREPGFETLPMKRLKRLKATMQPSPAGEWLAVRWFDLDEVLHDVFGLE